MVLEVLPGKRPPSLMLERREPRRSDESEEDYEKREASFWKQVKQNEQKLLDARERHAKRMGYEDSN